MPGKTEYDWSDLLDIARRLWSELGHAPTANAVNKAAGGGGTKRIQDVITAVGIEHGLHVSLYASLPEGLRKLITNPKDRPDPLPDVDCSPALAPVVREAIVQIAAACGAAERTAHRDAELLVDEAEARMAAELAAMSQRLQESAADADAEARMHADAVAEFERRLGSMSVDLATARAALEGRDRELDHLTGERERARESERETRARWEQLLEQRQAESAAYAAKLADVTERAFGAEAERDKVRELARRLTGELDALRRTADEAAAHRDSEIAGLRAELAAAARQAHQDTDRLRAVVEALLAEGRADRAERHRAPSSTERSDVPSNPEVDHAARA